MMVSMPSGKGSTVGFPLTACLAVKGNSVKSDHNPVSAVQITVCEQRGPLVNSTRPHRSALRYRLTQASGSEAEASVLEDI